MYRPPANALPTPGAPNYPAESMNRYLPPNANSAMSNGLPPVPSAEAVKQQLLPPTNQGPQKPLTAPAPAYSNGLAPNSSNHSSRTASPALLPPAAQQQSARPNVYGANAAALPPTSQSMPSNFVPPTMNHAPTPPMPVTHQQSHPNVDRLTNNLQSVRLNNGHGGPAANGHPQQMPPLYAPARNVQQNGNTFEAVPQLQSQMRPNMPPQPQPASFPPQMAALNQQQIQGSRPPQQEAQNALAAPRIPPMPANQTQPMPSQPNFSQINNGFGQQMHPPVAGNYSAPPPMAPGMPTVGKRPLYPPTVQAQPQLQPQFNQAAAQPMSNGPSTYYSQAPQAPQAQQQYQQPSVVQQGFNSLWGQNTVDLMQQRHILPTVPVEAPRVSLDHEFYESVNCSPE